MYPCRSIKEVLVTAISMLLPLVPPMVRYLGYARRALETREYHWPGTLAKAAGTAIHFNQQSSSAAICPVSGSRKGFP